MSLQADMKKDLDHLFASTDEAGRPRVPFVVDPSYSTGYVAMVQQALPLDRTVTIVANAQVFFFSASQIHLAVPPSSPSNLVTLCITSGLEAYCGSCVPWALAVP